MFDFVLSVKGEVLEKGQIVEKNVCGIICRECSGSYQNWSQLRAVVDYTFVSQINTAT